MNNQTTESQYVQATIFVSVFNLRSLVTRTNTLTPDQKEAVYAALEDLIKAVN